MGLIALFFWFIEVFRFVEILHFCVNKEAFPESLKTKLKELKSLRSEKYQRPQGPERPQRPKRPQREMSFYGYKNIILRV